MSRPGERPAAPDKGRRCRAVNLESTNSLFIFCYPRNRKVINLTAKGPAGELSVMWRGLFIWKRLCAGGCNIINVLGASSDLL